MTPSSLLNPPQTDLKATDLPTRPESTLARHPFESAPFLESWWEHLAPKFCGGEGEGQLFKTTKPVLKGLVPLQFLRQAGWNGVYYQSLNQADWESFRTLSDRTRWDCFEVRWNQTVTDSQVFNPYLRLGCKVLHTPVSGSPVIELQNGWEAYWQAKGSHHRQNINRQFKKAAHLQPELIFFEGEQGLAEFFARFFPAHQAYWQSKGEGSYFEDPRERAFIISWASKLQQSGQLCLSGLLLGGQITNLSFNVIHRNVLYALLTINTGVHHQAVPGIMALHQLTQHACAQGMETIDLGPGESTFKKKFATRVDPCFQTLIINPKSVAGQLYGAFKSGKSVSV
ncbi:GNAT family N-acetyltransferase [Vampirovibrio sp.]|uniref:GNAT family N-acetyltransferase n=1 Tax=Vampirovibrio sp. TaxID=2717857 RepID=UPI003593978B